jgi:hypothetical protein
MVDHSRELLREQTKVQRVQHRPHAGNREVRLDVLLGVPQERPDPVPGLDPEPDEGRREPRRAIADLGERRSPRAVRRRRHDLASPVDLTAVLEQVRDRERKILHRAQHDETPR